MRTRDVCVAGLMTWLIVSTGCFGQLLDLKNASFEAADDPEDWTSDRAESWGRWGHWMNRETGWTPTFEGDCLVGYHHWRVFEDDTSGIYQDIEGAPAGAWVLFTVEVYKDQHTDAESVELRLEPEGGGNAIASKSYVMGDLPWGRWITAEVSGETGDGGLRVLIIVKPKESGTRQGALKFDSASLRRDQGR